MESVLVLRQKKGRAPCCSKVGLYRGAWSDEEDQLLTNYIQTHGEAYWRSIPAKAGLLRCGKSCRLRWMNYLRPGITRGKFTEEENSIIIRLQSLYGNRWSYIATELCGRTDNDIKNHWNSHLKRKAMDECTDNQVDEPKTNKKLKKYKRKQDEHVPHQPQPQPQPHNSSLSPSLSLRENAGFDNEAMNGASSSSTMDFSTLFEMDDKIDMPFDGFDLMMMNRDESDMLQKLYDEYSDLLQYGDDGDGW